MLYSYITVTVIVCS